MTWTDRLIGWFTIAWGSGWGVWAVWRFTSYGGWWWLFYAAVAVVHAFLVAFSLSTWRRWPAPPDSDIK